MNQTRSSVENGKEQCFNRDYWAKLKATNLIREGMVSVAETVAKGLGEHGEDLVSCD